MHSLSFNLQVANWVAQWQESPWGSLSLYKFIRYQGYDSEVSNTLCDGIIWCDDVNQLLSEAITPTTASGTSLLSSTSMMPSGKLKTLVWTASEPGQPVLRSPLTKNLLWRHTIDGETPWMECFSMIASVKFHFIFSAGVKRDCSWMSVFHLQVCRWLLLVARVSEPTRAHPWGSLFAGCHQASLQVYLRSRLQGGWWQICATGERSQGYHRIWWCQTSFLVPGGHCPHRSQWCGMFFI